MREHIVQETNTVLLPPSCWDSGRKYRAAAHTSGGDNAERRDQEDLPRSCGCGWEAHAAQAACITRSPGGGPRRPASSHSYLHDDVKGQGRAAGCRWRCPACRKRSPWVGRWVPKRALSTEELLCSQEAGFGVLPTLPTPTPISGGRGIKKSFRFQFIKSLSEHSF